MVTKDWELENAPHNKIHQHNETHILNTKAHAKQSTQGDVYNVYLKSMCIFSVHFQTATTVFQEVR